MELWHILVLSAVRLGLDANYDRLEDFANHHKLIRQILGVETEFGEGKRFSTQSIKDNVRLLDEGVKESDEDQRKGVVWRWKK